MQSKRGTLSRSKLSGLSDISWLLKFFRSTVDSLGSRRHIEVRNRFVTFALLEMMKLTAQNEGRFTPEFFFSAAIICQ